MADTIKEALKEEVEKEEDGTTIFEFELIPSMELIRYFMSYGRDIRVLKPEWIELMATGKL